MCYTVVTAPERRHRDTTNKAPGADAGRREKIKMEITMEITSSAKNRIQSAIKNTNWETINDHPADLDAIIDTLIRIADLTDGLTMNIVGSNLLITGTTATCSRWSMELKEAGFRLDCHANGLSSWIWCRCPGFCSDSSRAG